MHFASSRLFWLQASDLGPNDKTMETAIMAMKVDASVTDIVRAVVKGVITPRHAIKKLETMMDKQYAEGLVQGRDMTKAGIDL